MHKTIWLDGLRRQVFAKKIGRFPRGFIIDTLRTMKNKTKKKDFRNNIESKDETTTKKIGVSMAKEVAPGVVILRWQISIDSFSSAALLGSGSILTSFSDRLQSFS